MPRQKTPTYYLFYLLFSTDTWRLAIGFVAAIFLAPLLFAPDQSTMSKAMLYVMIAAIGWAVSRKPARWITTGLKRVLL